MVLERLVTSTQLEHKPSLILGISFIFVSMAILLSIYVFRSNSGLVTVLLTVFPAIPFFLNLLRREEHLHEILQLRKQKHKIWVIYRPLIETYFLFFVGVALSVAFWASFLPQPVSDTIFSNQKAELASMRILTLGLTIGAPTFMELFTHNMGVLALMFIFSFVYGMGSIFLLAWNASILGVFIEANVRSYMHKTAQFGLFAFPLAFIAGSTIGLLSVALHGMFEITAFFLSSVSGGMLSMAISHHQFGRPGFHDIMKDAMKVMFVAVVFLAIAALIESLYGPLSLAG